MSSDARIRLIAAENLADLLQYDAEQTVRRTLTREQRTVLMNRLIHAVVTERDSDEAREAMLNGVSWGSSNEPDIEWDHFVLCLPDFDPQCLEHALTALGNTGNSEYEQVIEQFVADPSPLIRAAAEDALDVLRLGGCQAD